MGGKIKDRMILIVSIGAILFAVIGIGVTEFNRWNDNRNFKQQAEALEQLKQSSEVQQNDAFLQEKVCLVSGVAKALDDIHQVALEKQKNMRPAEILPQYQALYEQNSNMVGWLTIDDTIIDYPVMQTMDQEDYYLFHDFYGEENINGCLILDTDSWAGTGTKEYNYLEGTAPTTNLIIHGHTMKSGMMFGNLKYYSEEEYGKAHNILKFDSLYEHREYELIATFYSQVFYSDQDVFKYYQFFQANTQEEFDNWYNNIKSMSLYDTGVTAELGDEFITLSCCSYQVEDGRFVVVAKRIV